MMMIQSVPPVVVVVAVPPTALLEEAQYLVQRWSPSLEAQAHACILESAARNDMAALLLLRDRGGFSIEVGLVESLAAGHLDLYEDCIRQRDQRTSPTKRSMWLLAAGGSEAIWLAAARAESPTVLDRVAETLPPPYPITPSFLKQLYATAASPRAALFVRARLGADLPPVDARTLPLGRGDVLRAVIADDDKKKKDMAHGDRAQTLADDLLASAVTGNALSLVRELCAGALAPLLPPASSRGRRAATALGGAALPLLLELPDATWPAWALPAYAAAGDYATVEILLDHLHLAVDGDETATRITASCLSTARGHIEYQLRGKKSTKSPPPFDATAVAAKAVLQRLKRAEEVVLRNDDESRG
jgi:hypothetical protein